MYYTYATSIGHAAMVDLRTDIRMSLFSRLLSRYASGIIKIALNLSEPSESFLPSFATLTRISDDRETVLSRDLSQL